MRLSLTILVAAAMASSAHAERIKLLTTGAFQPVALELAPRFEVATGNQVDIVADTAGALTRRVDGGEDFDVLVLTVPVVQAYGQAGKLAAVSRLASSGIGVAVKAGTPVPPIRTLAQFKQALLDAKHVAYIAPSSGGSSGPYLVSVFERLGVADEVAAKAVLVNGGAVATRLVSGEADLAMQQMSELLPVPGVTVVGPLPDEIQRYTSYGGGVNPASKHRAAADAFMALLAGQDAAAIIQAKGMRADR